MKCKPRPEELNPDTLLGDRCPACKKLWARHGDVVKTCHELQRVCHDYDYDERVIRKLCRRVLPARKINGDDYGVPTLAGLVDMLVLEIERLRKTLN